jgi:hypothetical protein
MLILLLIVAVVLVNAVAVPPLFHLASWHKNEEELI